jgi:predicted esterase
VFSAVHWVASALVVCLLVPLPVRAEVTCDADSDCFYVPEVSSDSAGPLPALLILSCVGATDQDLDSNRAIADSLGWILASCHGSRNHRTGADNDKDIMNTVSKLLSNYPVDSRHLYICGFSGMGIQALQEVVLRPEFFRGAVQSCAPWRELPPANPAALYRHAAYLVTREGDWNREGNERWQRYLEGLGVAAVLSVTEGNHESGGTAELLEGCRWLQENTRDD